MEHANLEHSSSEIFDHILNENMRMVFHENERGVGEWQLNASMQNAGRMRNTWTVSLQHAELSYDKSRKTQWASEKKIISWVNQRSVMLERFSTLLTIILPYLIIYFRRLLHKQYIVLFCICI